MDVAIQLAAIGAMIAGCGAQPEPRASIRPRVADPTTSPLRPADVGLPDEPTPDPKAPPPPRPRPQTTSGYYRREECPPAGPYGCVTQRVITSVDLRIDTHCRGRSGSWRGGRLLRRIDPANLVIDGDLERAHVREGWHGLDRRLAECLPAGGGSGQLVIRAMISPAGVPQGVHITGLEPDAAACARLVVEGSRFPREAASTAVSWAMDFVVEDPAAIAPLDC